jgi:hypothetical protein
MKTKQISEDGSVAREAKLPYPADTSGNLRPEMHLFVHHEPFTNLSEKRREA